MTTDQLKELYLARQSCRAFSPKPVPKTKIEEICSLAGLAPSACDLQPWKIYAVTGKKLTEVVACMKKRGKAPFIDNVPAILVIAEDSRASSAKDPALSYFAPGDTGELTAHLILAAKAAGLDTCILGWRDAPELKEILSLPDGLSVPYAVALGYAEEGYEIRPKKRKPLQEILEFID